MKKTVNNQSFKINLVRKSLAYSLHGPQPCLGKGTCVSQWNYKPSSAGLLKTDGSSCCLSCSSLGPPQMCACSGISQRSPAPVFNHVQCNLGHLVIKKWGLSGSCHQEFQRSEPSRMENQQNEAFPGSQAPLHNKPPAKADEQPSRIKGEIDRKDDKLLSLLKNVYFVCVCVFSMYSR